MLQQLPHCSFPLLLRLLPAALPGSLAGLGSAPHPGLGSAVLHHMRSWHSVASSAAGTAAARCPSACAVVKGSSGMWCTGLTARQALAMTGCTVSSWRGSTGHTSTGEQAAGCHVLMAGCWTDADAGRRCTAVPHWAHWALSVMVHDDAQQGWLECGNIPYCSCAERWCVSECVAACMSGVGACRRAAAADLAPLSAEAGFP